MCVNNARVLACHGRLEAAVGSQYSKHVMKTFFV